MIPQMNPNDIVEGLTSMDSEVRLHSVRSVKNIVIGNRTKKLFFVQLGVLPKLADILSGETESAMLVQSATAVGSIAYGDDECIQAVLDSNVLSPLISTLSHPDMKVVEAGARSLKIIYQSPKAPREKLFENNCVDQIIRLLLDGSESAVECCACVLARCCENPTYQQIVSERGAVHTLINLLCSAFYKCHEAALDSLVSLSRNNAEITAVIASQPRAVEKTLSLLKDKRPRIRLLAATCLANLNRAGAIPALKNEISTQVLPTVIKLFGEPGAKEDAPRTLAHLIGDSEELQKVACDADSVSKLTAFLGTEKVGDRLLENVLTALAELSSLREESRKLVLQSKVVLPSIIQAMQDDNPGVRQAACMCARSLSRSVKNLRTELVDVGLATPLLKLLNDPCLEVQRAASATLCNIVLDFSPMKQIIIDQGGVQRLVTLTQSMDPQMRLNSVWALKNLSYMATPSVKVDIMQTLTYSTLFSLIRENEPAIQEQALTMLRNLACGKEKDIAALLDGAGEGLFAMLADRLASEHENIVVQSLYVVCNVATGVDAHKTAIMRSEPILQRILGHLSHPSAAVRIAATWCVINLTWQEGNEVLSETEARVDQLKALGFEAALQAGSDDSNVDVRDRVKRALEQFNNGHGPPQGSWLAHMTR